MIREIIYYAKRKVTPAAARPKLLAAVTILCVGGVAAVVVTPDSVLGHDRVIPWEVAAPVSRGMNGAALRRLEAALEERGTEALLVARRGAIIHEWYAPERWYRPRALLPPEARGYGTASMAKAVVGGMTLLAAYCDGRVDPDDPAWAYIPSWQDDPVRAEITVRHLATHSSGLDHDNPWHGTDWKERYRYDPAARFRIALAEAPVVAPPGAELRYSSPGFSALAYVLAASLRDAPHSDLRELLHARVMAPLEIPSEAWSINYGAEAHEVDGLRLYELGGGARYTARAVARVAQLVLHRGEWQGRRIVEPACVDSAITYAGTALPEDWRATRHPAPAFGWWTNANGAWPALPRDTLVGAGAEHQVVVVIPSLDLIAVRFGQRPLGEANFGGDYWAALERELLKPLIRAVTDEVPEPIPDEVASAEGLAGEPRLDAIGDGR